MPTIKLFVKAFVSEDSKRWCVANSEVEGLYAEGDTLAELTDKIIYLASKSIRCGTEDIDLEIDMSRIFVPCLSD